MSELWEQGGLLPTITLPQVMVPMEGRHVMVFENEGKPLPPAVQYWWNQQPLLWHAPKPVMLGSYETVIEAVAWQFCTMGTPTQSAASDQSLEPLATRGAKAAAAITMPRTSHGRGIPFMKFARADQCKSVGNTRVAEVCRPLRGERPLADGRRSRPGALAAAGAGEAPHRLRTDRRRRTV